MGGDVNFNPSFYWPFVKLGATDVWRHKTRSFLTMLGMVFGVGSVIAMLAVGLWRFQKQKDRFILYI